MASNAPPERSSAPASATSSQVDDKIMEKEVMVGDENREQPNDAREESKDVEKGEAQSLARPAKDSNLVEFDGPDDAANPQNFSMKKKVAITASMGSMTFVVTFSSSIFAVAIQPVSEEFGVSTVVATLGVTLFLFGFVFGPIVFGPFSEVFGRRVPLFGGYLLFAIFQIPVATATNIETIMIFRFLGGFAASAPLAVVGGALADIFGPIQRAYAICVFAGGAFCGPVAGPIVGGFVTESYLGWRWTQWLTLIAAGLFGAIGLMCIPETSAQRILQLRARRLRFETKNWALHAKADEERVDFNAIMTVYLIRPFVMIVQEPILALITGYMSVLYGIVYLLFVAFPISFHEERGWSLGVSALPFCGYIVGAAIGTAIMCYSTATNFKRAYLKHGKPIPEERLPPMMFAAILLPASLFWFGWTSSPSITWVPQVLSVIPLGTGSLIAFWQAINYLIDLYGFYSNSALAVNTFIRSIAGAVFPLFAASMFHRLGVAWGMSLLGFITLAFAPAPVLFYIYGSRIRAKSRFAPTKN